MPIIGRLLPQECRNIVKLWILRLRSADWELLKTWLGLSCMCAIWWIGLYTTIRWVLSKMW